MALPDKYKGKSYAEIAKSIQKTYKDRNDPISMRGLNKDMNDLQEAQEYTKQLKAIEEQTAQMLQGQPQQMQGEGQPQAQAVQPVDNRDGRVDINTQPKQTFNRQASSDYNEKFAYGGKMNSYADGGVQGRIDGFGSSMEDNFGSIQMPSADVQGVDLSDNYRQQGAMQNSSWLGDTGNQMGLGLGLTAAPIIGNIAQLISLEETDEVSPRLANMDSSMSSLRGFTPRESSFDYVDLNNIERGITEASGRFTQNNLNASRGNAGAFVANELGNQANLYRSIGDARMKAQQQDLQVDQMNAAEKARVDAMKLKQAQAEASIGGRNEMFNARMQFNTDQINAQNEAAYESSKSQAWSDLFTNIGTVGKSLYQAGAIGEATGYSPFNNEYLGGTNSNAMGGVMNGNGDPDKKVVLTLDDTPGDKQFNSQEEFDNYFTGVAASKLKELGYYSDNLEPMDNVALNAAIPDYEEYRKNLKTAKGKKPGANSKKVWNDPFYKAIEKTRNSYGGKMKKK